MTKPPPTASQLARNERIRTAAIEGAKARAEIEARDIAIRKNTERLRALRLARESEAPAPAKPVKTAKASRKPKAGAKSASLSDFLRAEKDSGRRT